MTSAQPASTAGGLRWARVAPLVLFALAVISPSAEARGFVIDSFVVSLQVDPDAIAVQRETLERFRI